MVSMLRIVQMNLKEGTWHFAEGTIQDLFLQEQLPVDTAILFRDACRW